MFLNDGALVMYAELKSNTCFPENLYVNPNFAPYPEKLIFSPFPKEFPVFASLSNKPSL